jgi:two-component system, NarL family, nitrate/nitrite response regulator NarL
LNSSFTVIHEASSIEDAIPFIESLRPALVLVDLPDSREALPGGIGQIKFAAPRARVVVLTETVRVDRLADALSEGVDGYLLKNMSADALHQSLRLTLLGKKVLPSGLAHLLTDGRIASRNDTEQTSHINSLSTREMQILRCLRDGARNKQIAKALRISGGTVSVHVKATLMKIRVRNRTQAAIWAVDHGIAGVVPGSADGTKLQCRDGAGSSAVE